MSATEAIQVGARRRFCLVLVKPSHYDEDGYVIQWMRSPIPSNSLAALYGLAKDCAERHVLGDDVDIDIHAFDETNTRILPQRLAAMIEEAGAGMVMLAGVQSNQFPRALDIAKPLRARGIQVGIGGFHVSGVLAMLDGEDADLDRAEAMGLSLFAGEAEGRLEMCCATPPQARSSRSTITWTICPASRARRCRCCGSNARNARSPAPPASTPAAAVPTSVRSAPSSMCRAASRAAARPTTSSASCA